MKDYRWTLAKKKVKQRNKGRQKNKQKMSHICTATHQPLLDVDEKEKEEDKIIDIFSL